MQSLQQPPKDPAFVQNPYPFYERARALGPFFLWDDYTLVCTGNAAAVNAIFRDRRFGREPVDPLPIPPHLAPFYAVEAHSMLELEPPRHTRLRNLVLRAFTSRRIAGLAPDITALATELAESFPRGDFDLLTAFAQPLPVRIIARLLGVPEEMAPDLLRWSNAMVGMYMAGRTREMEDRAIAATTDFVAFLRAYVEERRARPADDLITQLIAAEMEGEKLSTDELISTCILLLNAGHEATVHTIGNGVKTLLETRTPLSALAPDAIEATVEEILRFDPPLHMFTRHAYEEVEVMGHTFRRGDQVGLLLAAANRDPGQWDQPDRFIPTRPAKPHVSFGAGLHFCVGAPLARLELQIALPILFRRHPNLTLVASPAYADVYHFHGLGALRVTT
ncbi:cytochrome P450 [Tabrizicola thermarum]|uniref:cytochrome P450 n=1 Tax=Tabrizicola thermarum TaxID=2670345 RepID=UPI000FFC2999|nr:cytochrome P450 [Tabrizicola thermarum]